MNIKYIGPRQSVTVAGYGIHIAGQIKDYPDAFAKKLLASSKRQQFEPVGGTKQPGGDKEKRSANEEQVTDSGDFSVYDFMLCH